MIQLPWYIGEPIRSTDTIGICVATEDGGERIEETIAEVLPTPDGNKTARAQACLLVTAPKLLAALARLETAARHRDNTMGDQCRLIEVKAELDAAAEEARAVIAEATKGGIT